MSAGSRLAVADSDEDEDDLLEGSEEPSQIGLGSRGYAQQPYGDRESPSASESNPRQANPGSLTTSNVHPDRPQHESTGSTERLQKDIRRAEKRLLDLSSPHVSANLSHPLGTVTVAPGGTLPSMDVSLITECLPQTIAISPGMMPIERRHTLHRDSPSLFIDPSRLNSVRRTASLRSQGRSSPSRKTASVVSSNYSADKLPHGLCGDDFLNHEPALMFRNTGSTTVNDDSSQIEMGRRSAIKRNEYLDHTNDPARSEPSYAAEPLQPSPNVNRTSDASSSLIWTPSDVLPTQSTKLGNDQGQTTMAGTSLHHATPDGQSSGSDECIAVATEREQRSSPIVQIPLRSPRYVNTEPTAAQPTSVQSKKRRQTDQVAPESVWEDINHGLPPADQYRPRASKRRSTVIATEKPHHAATPEKKSQVGRRKTMTDKTSIDVQSDQKMPDGNGLDSVLHDIKDHEGDQKDDDGVCDETNTSENNLPPPTLVLSPQNPALSESLLILPPERDAENPMSMAPPMIPSAKVGMAASVGLDITANEHRHMRKARRSHTTIYEDHPHYQGTRKSLSLTEQQKKRKRLALNHGDDTQSPLPHSKLRRISVADSDDEDELALDADYDQSDTEVVEVGSATIGVQNKAQRPEMKEVQINKTDAQPVKAKKRGRPRKAVAVAADEETMTPAQDVIAEEVVSNVREGAKSEPKSPELVEPDLDSAANVTKPITDAHDSNSTRARSAEPSAGDVAQDTVHGEPPPTTSPQGPSGPTHHSPLRATSPVPYRVGLSRRQRIPSLLRVVRPAATTTAATKGTKARCK